MKKKFKDNSSLEINNYNLDKNLRRLTKDKTYLELTEKEIELIELLNKNSFTKKKKFIYYMEIFEGCRYSYSRNTYL